MRLMSVVKLSDFRQQVYIIMGIDGEGCDQVVAVCRSYNEAKEYCILYLAQTEFYDVWIEKHPIL